jgi:CRISPR-associated endonuclease/helicase Cas3
MSVVDNAPIDSAPYFRYWGKARPSAPGQPAFHLLPYHALDVAAVGVEYIRRSPAFRYFLVRNLGIREEESLLDWVAFWLALHDLGKFAEAFQGQREDLFRQLRGRAPARGKEYTERHDSLGMQFWCDSLSRHAVSAGWFGLDGEIHENALNCWARAVTGHHGQPPKVGLSLRRFFDMREDRVAIHAFAEEVRALFLRPRAAAIPTLHSEDAFREKSTSLSWWIAGLAVLADWIGSNSEVFTYRHRADASLGDYWIHARALAAKALEASGVLPANRQVAFGFGVLFPEITRPSPLQAWATSAPITPGAQLHMLEDVTGAGKTEAALMLAHRLIAAGCADGFFVGLPTMATANAMYARIAGVYDRLFAGNANLVLAHGHKALVEEFAASVLRPGTEEADASQQDESATARCTAWLADHNKRALLAQAGVGTIDQALMAALQCRHQSLRLFGLFGKVLIVDEVHACDAYMQQVLETLLGLHASAGGSVILLSATLPQRMKQALLDAFANGCGQRQSPRITRVAYPLTTSWSSSAPHMLEETPIAARSELRRRITIRYENNYQSVIAEIIDALHTDRCVAWIRNSVADARDAYAELIKHVPPERVTLFHARFALGDRLDIENRVLDTFGRDSGACQRAGRLLVATQVAEQSLDVDFDLVVSDLAPIDRLIQRAGRLHRHVRNARGDRLLDSETLDERGDPVLWILGPEWTSSPTPDWFKRVFRKAAAVYPDHAQLWATACALRSGGIDMPDDARLLIESVFGDGKDPPEGLRVNANRAEGQAYGDASLGQLNSVKPALGYERLGNEWTSDAVTPSRLGEDTIEVLIARWQGDQLEPWRAHPVERHAWAYSSVRVPTRLILIAETPSSETRRDALASLKERLPGRGRWATVLAFDLRDGRWCARGFSSKQDKSHTEPTDWWYDPSIGLVEEKASGEPAPDAQSPFE